jgi:hypothetical protein
MIIAVAVFRAKDFLEPLNKLVVAATDLNTMCHQTVLLKYICQEHF